MGKANQSKRLKPARLEARSLGNLLLLGKQLHALQEYATWAGVTFSANVFHVDRERFDAIGELAGAEGKVRSQIGSNGDPFWALSVDGVTFFCDEPPAPEIAPDAASAHEQIARFDEEAA